MVKGETKRHLVYQGKEKIKRLYYITSLIKGEIIVFVVNLANTKTKIALKSAAVISKKPQNSTLDEAIILFESFYGKVTLDYSAKQMSKPYPIIVSSNGFIDLINLITNVLQPIQRMLGCMSHLCWHPVLSDIIAIDDTEYYFLQGNWYWKLSLKASNGATFLKQLSQDKAGEIKHHDSMVIVAAFHDKHEPDMPGKRYVGTIIKAENVHSCDTFHSALYLVGNTLEVATTSSSSFSSKYQIFAATHNVDGTFTMAAKLCHNGQLDRQISLVSFTRVGSTYNIIAPGKPVEFEKISAMFVHHPTGHLFIVSEAFLYIFSKVNEMETAKCLVTPMSNFLQCNKYSDSFIEHHDDDYFNLALAKFKGAKNVELGKCIFTFLPFMENGPDYSQHLAKQIHFDQVSSLTKTSAPYDSRLLLYKIMLSIFGFIVITILLIGLINYICRRFNTHGPQVHPRRHLDFNAALLREHTKKFRSRFEHRGNHKRR